MITDYFKKKPSDCTASLTNKKQNCIDHHTRIQTKNPKSEIPFPSSEQRKIIYELKANNNLKVVARAGTGKTTLGLLIASFDTNSLNKNHLILTYNTELARESNKQIQEIGLNNIQCRTYHSQVGICSNKICNNDTKLIKQVEKWKNGSFLSRISGYDIIILDESQDMRPSYYDALTFMLPPQTKNIQLVVMGDPKQLIYDYGHDDAASDKFLTHADKYFNRSDRNWHQASLTVSYRLTPKNAQFVNTIWNTDIVAGNFKDPNVPVEYWHLNTYSSEITRRIAEILDSNPHEDVLLLARNNLKSKDGKDRPLGSHVNSIIGMKDDNGKQKYKFHIRNSDADGRSNATNKVRAFTFCSSKGLTVPIVIIFGFDSFVGKHAPLNQMGVALSRASKRLILIHTINREGKSNPYYPGMNSQILREFVEKKIVIAPDGIPEDNTFIKKPPQPQSLMVTSITHCSAKTLIRLLEYCRKIVIDEGKNAYPVETKRTFQTGLLDTEEEFSAVYGTAIAFAFEYSRNKIIHEIEAMLNPILISRLEAYNCGRLLQVIQDHGVDLQPEDVTYIHQRYAEHMSTNDKKWMTGSQVIDMLKQARATFLKSLKTYGICDKSRYSDLFPEEYEKKVHESYSATIKSPEDFMFLANASLAFEGTHETLAQMGDDYSWVDKNAFKHGLMIFETYVPISSTFEVSRYVHFDPCIENEERCYDSIVGRVDIVDDQQTIYELKFTTSLNDEHELQTMLYAAQQCHTLNSKKGIGILINGRTGEVIRIEIEHENAMIALREAANTKL